MIAKLQNIANKLHKVEQSIHEFIQAELEQLKPIIEDLNVGQMKDGTRVDGTSLPNYSPTSVAVYGKPAGPIKLFDTGAFYRGVTVRVTQTEIELTDVDSKWGMLSERYGDVIGLSENSKNELSNEYLKPGLQKRVKEYLTDGIQ